MNHVPDAKSEFLAFRIQPLPTENRQDGKQASHQSKAT